MSSELKTSREAKSSAEKDLATFQAMTKNSRVEAVQDLSSAWTRLREKEMSLREKETRLREKETRLREKARSL